MSWLDDDTAASYIRIAWLTFALFWLWSSRAVKQTTASESRGSRWLHVFIVCVGVAITFQPLGATFGREFLPRSSTLLAVAILLAWSGVMFAIWARIYLGRNRSASVTLKQEHELIRGGPYRFVRHPIYSGMLLAFAGVVLAVDRMQALIGFAIVFLAFLRKSRIEDRLMTERLGDPYRTYKAETKAIVPGVL